MAWSREHYAVTADGAGLYYAAHDPETYGGAVLREAYSRGGTLTYLLGNAIHVRPTGR